jgi:hypothetical protein
MKIDNQGRTVETAVEARAGFLDRPVLVVSCVLAAATMFAAFVGVFKL